MALPGTLLRVGIDVLRSTVSAKTRSIILQVGDVLTGVAEADGVELLQTFGFVSRPPNAEAGKAAGQVVATSGGDRDVAIAGRDERGQELAGALGPGETAIYAAGPDGKSQGRILFKGNGSVSIYTAKGNVAGGASCTIQCNTDSIKMANEHGGISIDEDGIKLLTSGGSGIQIGKDGKIAIIGSEAAINAGSVSLGANAIMPVIWGPAGIAGVASTSVKVAP